MWAAEEGRVDIMNILLDAGAKLDVQNKRGGTALQWVGQKTAFFSIEK
jgi:ankyrin repeat protein